MTIPKADEARTNKQRIDAAARRARNAYQDQAASATTDCPLKGGAGVPPHAGNCTRCTADHPGHTTSHSLPLSDEAQREAKRFYDELRQAGQLGGVDLTRLDGEKGNMLGVLICVDDVGNTHVLRAFSGFIDDSGIADAPGYSPSIAPGERAAADEARRRLDDEVLPEIAALKQQLQAQTQAIKQDKLQDADLSGNSAKISAVGRDKTLDKDDKALALRALRAEREQFEAPYAERTRQVVQPVADRITALEQQADQQRAAIEEPMHGGRLLTNFKNETQTQRDACTDAERVTDGRTGNCAAPKLIAQAQRQSLVPVAIAEIWIGGDLGEQRDFGNGNPAGRYVPSCECCRSILGFALCGLSEQQGQLAKR